ncbi:hypothetical protein V8C42DRAFT_316283 [Trichoderma barbatum]
MFRPRGNAGQASPPETSTSQDTHQPMFHSARNDEQLSIPAASTSRVTGQSMFRPVRTVGPATTPAVSSSRLAHQGLPQSVSQPTSDDTQNHTPTIQPFQRPPRFLSSSRGNAEPANASTTSASRVTRPVTQLIDSIESDSTPPPPATRNIQKPMLQSGRSSVTVLTNPPAAAASSTSRTSRRPFLQQLRNTGPDSIESANAPSTSTTRGPNPLPLPDRIPNGPTTTPVTSTSHVTYQPAPQPVSNAGHNRNPPTSATRMAQQSTVQSTRHAIPAHTPTAAASRMAQQPTMQPTRPLPAQNPSASSSRTPQQPTFRPLRATAAPVNTPVPSAPTSSSATILEFICLYTHDLRRKKKRWQDGKLKFHTFNKKYMVYDDGGSFVGDGHWQGDDGEFTEGLEMNLDRGMAIVQVMECTGSKEQDLGEVLGKRVREVEERRINAATKNPASTASSSNPAKRSRGIAVVLQAPAPTAAATTTTTTIITTAIPPPQNGGAWSKHAADLLGMTRPSR